MTGSGIEEDGIYIHTTQKTFSTYGINANPIVVFGSLVDNESTSGGITITVVTKLATNRQYAQIFYEFGYLGTDCLVQVHDNNAVFPNIANADAAYFSNYTLVDIAQDVADEGSHGQGLRIVNSSGCSEADVTQMFFNGIEFQDFGADSVDLDAVIIDAGEVDRF